MRTTLTIDDDVLSAAKELARRERRSAGEVLSELARRGLTVTGTSSHGVEEAEAFYGFRPLPRRTKTIVTNEMINRLRDEDSY